MLQQDIAQLRARQDSTLRETQRQNRMLLDTLRNIFDVQRNLGGQASTRFQDIERQLSQLEEMLNQTRLLIGQLTERLDQQAAGQVSILPSGGGGGGVSQGEAEAMYAAAVEKMREGSYATALAGFTQLVEQYPTDARAAEAQFQIGEIHYLQERWTDAIDALARIEQQWHESPRAPDALLRAGIIAQERNMRTRARELYQRVRQSYPSSDAAQEAARRLRTIGG
jgi:tol-pal system protein YbgF